MGMRPTLAAAARKIPASFTTGSPGLGPDTGSRQVRMIWAGRFITKLNNLMNHSWNLNSSRRLDPAAPR
jgi:hypothetical protein